MNQTFRDFDKKFDSSSRNAVVQSAWSITWRELSFWNWSMGEYSGIYDCNETSHETQFLFLV